MRLLMLIKRRLKKVIPEHLVCEFDWIENECNLFSKYKRLYLAYMAVRSGDGSLRRAGRLVGGSPEAWGSESPAPLCLVLLFGGSEVFCSMKRRMSVSREE